MWRHRRSDATDPRGDRLGHLQPLWNRASRKPATPRTCVRARTAAQCQKRSGTSYRRFLRGGAKMIP